MTTRSRKRWTYGFALASILAFAFAAAATQVTAPEASAGQQEIPLDAAALDRYVANYQVGQRVFSVTRQGTQLSAQISGQPKMPIYPGASNEFLWRIGDLRVTFDVSADGSSKSATIHQNGQDIVMTRLDDSAAQTLEQQLAQRSSAQQPQAGSEAALRKFLLASASGALDYDDMTPTMQSVVRQQQSSGLLRVLGPLGPPESVEFKGVTPEGIDKYVVIHQGGKQSQWLIELDADGKISELAVLPRF